MFTAALFISILSCSTRFHHKEPSMQDNRATLAASLRHAATISHRNPDSALIAYYGIVNRFDHKMDDSCRSIIADACLCASRILVRSHNYTEAMSLLTRGLSIYGSSKPSMLEVRMLNNIGNIHLLNQNYSMAEHIYSEAYDKIHGIGNDLARSQILCNQVVSNAYIGKAKKARHYLDIYKSLKLRTHNYTYNSKLMEGCVLRAEHKYTQSVEMLNKAMKYAADNDLPAEYKCDALKELSNTYKAAGMAHEYLDRLQQLYNLAKAEGVEDEQMFALRVLPEYYEKKGEKDKADALYAESERLSRKILNPTDYNRINSYYAINEHEKQLDEISLLRTEKLLEHERSRVARTIAGVAGISLVLAILAIIVIVKQKRRITQSYRDLYELNLSQDKAEKMQLSARISDEQTRVLSEKIRHVMDDTDELYDPDFSLARLAELTESNNWYVSKVINEVFGVNFRSLVNECRIKEARRRMADKAIYGQYTLQALAESVGFRSMSTFNAAFKKIVKMTPSAYMKETRRHNASDTDNL